MAKDPKKTPYQLKFSPYKLAPSHPPPLPVGQADVGLSGIPADLFHSHSSGASEEWHLVGTSGEPGFVNGWVNYDPGNDRPCAFKKAHGTVFLRGIIKNGSVNTTAFILPVGYRPIGLLNMHFACGIGVAPGVGACRVNNTGGVDIVTGTNVWNDLAGIIFRTD